MGKTSQNVNWKCSDSQLLNNLPRSDKFSDQRIKTTPDLLVPIRITDCKLRAEGGEAQISLSALYRNCLHLTLIQEFSLLRFSLPKLRSCKLPPTLHHFMKCPSFIIFQKIKDVVLAVTDDCITLF